MDSLCVLKKQLQMYCVCRRVPTHTTALNADDNVITGSKQRHRMTSIYRILPKGLVSHHIYGYSPVIVVMQASGHTVVCCEFRDSACVYLKCEDGGVSVHEVVCFA